MTLVKAIINIGLIRAGEMGYMFPDDAIAAKERGDVDIIAVNVKEKAPAVKDDSKADTKAGK